MITLFWLAGGLLLLMAATNIPFRRRMPFGRDLASVTPIIRQICTVHHVYIGGVIAAQGTLCLLFARDLAAGGPLASFLNGAMAVFWGARLGVQLFYLDRATRRAHPGWDAAFMLAFGSLAAGFAFAALGGTI